MVHRNIAMSLNDVIKNNVCTLSSEELANFHRLGYAGPFKLYEPEEMNEVWEMQLRRQLLDSQGAAYSKGKGLSGATDLGSYDRHLDIPFLFNHVKQRKIAERVASILGPNVLCWRTEFFPKYPGDEGTDWHQVSSFSGVTNSKKPHIEWPQDADFAGTINVWTAFTESTVDNGCLQFTPGTHRHMYYDEAKKAHYDSTKINKITKNGVQRGFFGYDYEELKVDPNWVPDESKAVSMIMQPGECIIFWSTLLHASHPHNGKDNKMRLGYTARYVPTSVKIYPDIKELEEFGGKASLDKYRAVLVSGENEHTHNKVITTLDS